MPTRVPLGRRAQKRYAVFSFVDADNCPTTMPPVSDFPKCTLTSAPEVLSKLGNVETFSNKRLKSFEQNVALPYLDVTFFSCFDSIEEVGATITPRDVINHENTDIKLEKACYAEVQMVDPKKDMIVTPIDEDDPIGMFQDGIGLLSCGNQRPPSPEYDPRLRGYIIIAYKTMEDMESESFVATWKTWTGVRFICMQLPRQLGLRRISFFQHLSHTSVFSYILVIEITNLALYAAQTLNLMSGLKLRLCGHVALYRQLDNFPLDPICRKIMNLSPQNSAKNRERSPNGAGPGGSAKPNEVAELAQQLRRQSQILENLSGNQAQIEDDANLIQRVRRESRSVGRSPNEDDRISPAILNGKSSDEIGSAPRAMIDEVGETVEPPTREKSQKGKKKGLTKIVAKLRRAASKDELVPVREALVSPKPETIHEEYLSSNAAPNTTVITMETGSQEELASMRESIPSADRTPEPETTQTPFENYERIVGRGRISQDPYSVNKTFDLDPNNVTSAFLSHYPPNSPNYDATMDYSPGPNYEERQARPRSIPNSQTPGSVGSFYSRHVSIGGYEERTLSEAFRAARPPSSPSNRRVLPYIPATPPCMPPPPPRRQI